MYNMLFGVNNVAPLLFELADIDYHEIQRCRDIILKKNHTIEILTRTGGNNDKTWPNAYLKCRLNYVKHFTDKFDRTYAHFIFTLKDVDEDDIDLDKLYQIQSRKSLNLKTMFKNEFKHENNLTRIISDFVKGDLSDR